MLSEIFSGNALAEALADLKLWVEAHPRVIVKKQHPPVETREPDGKVVSVSIRLDYEESK